MFGSIGIPEIIVLAAIAGAILWFLSSSGSRTQPSKGAAPVVKPHDSKRGRIDSIRREAVSVLCRRDPAGGDRL
jgi:hypothetical protein